MSRKCESQQPACVSLVVDEQAIPRFTTLLQAGIYLKANQGESIGRILATLPGFTEEYVGQQVQTIFLDGLPADDLGQQIYGTEAVLAISAHMPGLAGAIFKKGGAHASLRTTTDQKTAAATVKENVTVRLKLFNVLARERGEGILANGCCIMASGLGKFLAYRPPLAAAIREARFNGQKLEVQELLGSLPDKEMIQLTIRRNHGS